MGRKANELTRSSQQRATKPIAQPRLVSHLASSQFLSGNDKSSLKGREYPGQQRASEQSLAQIAYNIASAPYQDKYASAKQSLQETLVFQPIGVSAEQQQQRLDRQMPMQVVVQSIEAKRQPSAQFQPREQQSLQQQ